MTLRFPQVNYRGPALDDAALLARVPAFLRDLLSQVNGFAAFGGAFHLRGACTAPAWHALREAWEGDAAFHVLYDWAVSPDDVPFAEDAFGDQYLVRDGAVWRLWAETGETARVADGVEAFLRDLLARPAEALGFDPADALEWTGGSLAPGRTLHAFPPFFVDIGDRARSVRPLDALEARGSRAAIARQVKDLPDGARIEFRLAE